MDQGRLGHKVKADNANNADSQMHSSPSEDGDDTELMFPAANDPPTPPTITQTQTSQPFAELSPPASQDPREDLDMRDSLDTRVFKTNGSDLLSESDLESAMTNQFASVEKSKNSDDENQPGYAWKNKRTQEEYTRALEQVVDKKWTMRDFGDPFDERDMES